METRATAERGSSRRARNRRGEGGRLRQEIVAAATRLLQERGSGEAVTLRSVAREVGIAAPSIYAHFRDADAILAAVIEETFEALTAALRASREGIDDPVLRLTAQCRGYLRFAAEYPGLYGVLFGPGRAYHGRRAATRSFADVGTNSTSEDPTTEAAGAVAFAMLVDAIAACVAGGRSASEDPFLDSVNLWAALHGYIGLRIATPAFPWPDESAMLESMIAGQARIVPRRG